MAVQVPKRWSYSAWSTFNKCMYAFYGKHILKIQEKPGYPVLRGIEMHAKAEGYLKGKVTSLPKELKTFDAHYKQLKKMNPVVEQFWGVTASWQFTERDGWCVMKMDAAVEPEKPTGVLYIQDLKTGKEYTDHEQQGSLYGTIGLAKYPKISKAEVEFWYSDQGYSTTFTFTRAQLLKLKTLWIERGMDVMKPRRPAEYKPTPSANACRYCVMRTDKGGNCNEWRNV